MDTAAAPAARGEDDHGDAEQDHSLLWFDTEGEEAATFYTGLLENGRIIDVTRYGSAGPRPEGMVMTVVFELERAAAGDGGGTR